MTQDVSDPDACEKCWAGKHKECAKQSPRDPKSGCGCEVCACDDLEGAIEDLNEKMPCGHIAAYRNWADDANHYCILHGFDLMKLQNDELRKALDLDKTGLAAALAAIREEVKGRRWISDGRGSYTFDDDRYRKETGWAFDAIEKIAADALAASGKLAHEALTEKRIDEKPICGAADATGVICKAPKGHPEGEHWNMDCAWGR